MSIIIFTGKRTTKVISRGFGQESKAVVKAAPRTLVARKEVWSQIQRVQIWGSFPMGSSDTKTLVTIILEDVLICPAQYWPVTPNAHVLSIKLSQFPTIPPNKAPCVYQNTCVQRMYHLYLHIFQKARINLSI